MITTIDADGVALAAIKGLHDLLLEKETLIEQQEKKVTAMQERLAWQEKQIEAMLERLGRLDGMAHFAFPAQD